MAFVLHAVDWIPVAELLVGVLIMTAVAFLLRGFTPGEIRDLFRSLDAFFGIKAGFGGTFPAQDLNDNG